MHGIANPADTVTGRSAAGKGHPIPNRRYQEHVRRNWRILLFVRQTERDARGITSSYLFLGPVRYIEHEREKPMRIIWELERPMPPEFFARVKVAAGEPGL